MSMKQTRGADMCHHQIHDPGKETLDWKTAGKKAERIEKIPDMCLLYPQQHCLEKKKHY
jgi:hypothetical protein